MRPPKQASAQHSRSLNEKILRQCISGSSRSLQALVDAYSYEPDDMRPLHIVLPFLRSPPPFENDGNERTACDMALRGLSSIIVLDNVGSAAGRYPHTVSQFLSTVGEDWSSIFAWCTYLTDYAESSLPPPIADEFCVKLGQFLFIFAMPALSITMLPDYAAPINLAFRLWDSGYNNGRVADISPDGLSGIVTVFANWLLGDEDTGQAIVDWLVQEKSRVKGFFRSLKRRFNTLRHRIRSKEIDQDSAEKLFLMLTAIVTSTSQVGNGAVDPLILKTGTLEALSQCLGRIVCTRPSGEAKQDSMIAGLVHLYEVLEWVAASGGHFLAKLEHLVQGGMAGVIYAAFMNHTPGTLQYDMACSLLTFLTPYLPYPPILCAIGQSLGTAEHRTIPRSNCLWDKFGESLVRSAVTVADHEECLRHSCDNLQVRLPLHSPSLPPLTMDDDDARDTTPIAGRLWKAIRPARPVLRSSTARRHAKNRIGSTSTVRSVQLFGNQLEVHRKSRGEWIPSGSKGGLAAMLFQIYRERRHKHVEDIRAFAGLMPQDVVTIFDFRSRVEPLVILLTKAEYLAEVRDCRHQPMFGRVQAMVMASEEPTIRLAGAIFPHNEESIHILAQISGTPECDFKFLRGAWVVGSAFPDLPMSVF
ncbi:hypothetical protein NMY22_g15948 [Coprinellus aureogranulatus]|nr:hypothetical protein NMY22_g15948 [Coprinellus aureogranulatus]